MGSHLDRIDTSHLQDGLVRKSRGLRSEWRNKITSLPCRTPFSRSLRNFWNASPSTRYHHDFDTANPDAPARQALAQRAPSRIGILT
jgi:hypothetical protein